VKIVDLFLHRNYARNAFYHPLITINSLIYSLRYPEIVKVDLNVKKLINLPLGAVLHKAAIRTKNNPSANIIEVGAFEGKSTCFLSLAAKRVGKNVKSFELFSGLPVADDKLDKGFSKGMFNSSKDTYINNVKKYGYEKAVDLIEGDARKTLLPTIDNGGYCMAFIDVDVYDVTSEILTQLYKISKGGEVIIIHDTYSPGIQKAINEFLCLVNKELKIEKPMINTMSITLPNRLNGK
jgi:hypothetical protein